MTKISRLIEQMEQVLYDLKENTIYLYEMSQPQGRVRQNVRNLSEQIIAHLIKIIMYGKEENETLHHWCAELHNWLNQCVKDKIKRKGKDTYPSSEELYRWLTDYYKDSSDIEGTREWIEDDYTYQGHEERDYISDEEIYNNIDQILEEICTLYSTKTGSIDKLQELVTDYILG